MFLVCVMGNNKILELSANAAFTHSKNCLNVKAFDLQVDTVDQAHFQSYGH